MSRYRADANPTLPILHSKFVAPAPCKQVMVPLIVIDGIAGGT
jgi:hypothetical protein